MTDELVQTVLHADSVEVGVGDEGSFKIYIEKPDGSGVAIPIDEESYQNIEKTFTLTEKPGEFSCQY